MTQIPRNIILMEEHENGLKGKYGEVSFSVDENDISLTKWCGTMLTRNMDILSFKFICDSKFPITAPKITFDESAIESNRKVRAICNSDGTFNVKLELVNWSPDRKIGEYLHDIRRIVY